MLCLSLFFHVSKVLFMKGFAQIMQLVYSLFACYQLQIIVLDHFIHIMCFTLLFDHGYASSMSHQKIILFITYLLEDEQELSLGMLIRVKHIYNFLLFHASYMPLLHVFTIILHNFQAFCRTKILTRCPTWTCGWGLPLPFGRCFGPPRRL